MCKAPKDVRRREDGVSSFTLAVRAEPFLSEAKEAGFERVHGKWFLYGYVGHLGACGSVPNAALAGSARLRRGSRPMVRMATSDFTMPSRSSRREQPRAAVIRGL